MKILIIVLSHNNDLYSKFYKSQKKTLKIRKGESTSFSVFFIPLEKETHYCKVIFCD